MAGNIICAGDDGLCDRPATVYVWVVLASPSGWRWEVITGKGAVAPMEREPEGARCADHAVSDMEHALGRELAALRGDHP